MLFMRKGNEYFMKTKLNYKYKMKGNDKYNNNFFLATTFLNDRGQLIH